MSTERSELQLLLKDLLPDLCGIIPPLAAIVAEYAEADPPERFSSANPAFHPICITVSPDKIIITETEGFSRFRRDGSFLSFSAVSEPAAITYNNGLLYVALRYDSIINVYKPDGAQVHSWPVAGIPYGIAASGDHLFISFSLQNDIRVYNLDGTFERILTAESLVESSLAIWEDLLFAVPWNNNCVHVYRTTTGELVRKWNGPEKSGMNGIAVHRGQVFVTQSYRKRVAVYSLEGEFIGSINCHRPQADGAKAKKEQDDYWPIGVAVTDQWIFVNVLRPSWVLRFRRDESLVPPELDRLDTQAENAADVAADD